MEARRCLALACLAAFGALFLQGCGGVTTTTTTTTTTTSEEPHNTTTSTSTSATTVTTATTETTATGYGNCTGKDISDFDPSPHGIYNEGSACFCFYVGHCFYLFVPKCWNVSIDVSWCQKKWCGQAPFYTGPQFVSFWNFHQAPWDAKKFPGSSPDLLTIPRLWFLNINHLKDLCEDKGKEEIAHLLNRGRSDWQKNDFQAQTPGAAPQWQCLHVQRWVGVEWLHLHSFTGQVKAEALPDVDFPYNPRHALCCAGSRDAYDCAQWMMDNIPIEWGASDVQDGHAPDAWEELMNHHGVSNQIV